MSPISAAGPFGGQPVPTFVPMVRRMPASILFLRSPGGISHHPDETVLPEDVAAALAAGARFLELLEARVG